MYKIFKTNVILIASLASAKETKGPLLQTLEEIHNQ